MVSKDGNAQILESERLPDPCKDRHLTDEQLQRPPLLYLTSERVFGTGDKPNVELVKNYIFQGGRIGKELLQEIMQKAGNLLGSEPNLLKVDGKVVIIGDIHGQFYDLHNMLRKLARPGHHNTKLLFLGDYVDRGNYGPEVAAMLFTLKLYYPNDVFLLRGNHESRDMAENFNFR